MDDDLAVVRTTTTVKCFACSPWGQTNAMQHHHRLPLRSLFAPFHFSTPSHRTLREIKRVKTGRFIQNNPEKKTQERTTEYSAVEVHTCDECHTKKKNNPPRTQWHLTAASPSLTHATSADKKSKKALNKDSKAWKRQNNLLTYQQIAQSNDKLFKKENEPHAIPCKTNRIL